MNQGSSPRPIPLERGVFDPDRRAIVAPDGSAIALTPTEARLLGYFAANPGRALTHEALLTEVWGYRPGVETRTLYVTVARLRQKIELDPSKPRHVHVLAGSGYRFEPLAPSRAPARPSESFIGRADELARLADHVASGRLVTLTGPGGTGKTRLARQFVEARVQDGQGALLSVDLSEARTEGAVTTAVARAMELPLGAGDPMAQVTAALAARGVALLFLDNFEQVPHAAAATVGAWLAAVPALRVLVTSREPLRLPGEEVFPLEPLPVPPPGESESDAVTLFTVRAARAAPEWVPAPAERAEVADVVRLLDGLPLAIELAAARLAVLSVGSLRVRLARRFEVLRATRPDRPPRHQTMWAAIAWSWEMLEPWEQAAAAQLSVFEGPFTLEAAEAVVDVTAWPEAPPVLDLAQILVERSLVRRVPSAVPGEPTRLGMLVSIRDFASERLAESADGAAAEQRHGAWYARLGSHESRDALRGPNGVAAFRALLSDLPNVEAAIRRAVARGDAAVVEGAAVALGEALKRRGPMIAGIELLTFALTAPVHGAGRARVLASRAELRRLAGQLGEAEADLREGLALAGDDPRTRSTLENLLGIALKTRGRLEEAYACYHRALRAADSTGATELGAIILGNLGILHLERGEPDEARRCLEDARGRFAAVGNVVNAASVLNTLGNLESDAGRLGLALARLEEAAAAASAVGNRVVLAASLSSQGGMLNELGRSEEALQRYRASREAAIEAGDSRSASLAVRGAAWVHLTRGELDLAEEAFREAERLAARHGIPVELGRIASRQGEVALHRGSLERARTKLEEARAHLEAVGSRPYLVTALELVAQLEIAEGDVDAAAATLVGAEGVLAGHPLAARDLFLELGWADVALARRDGAAAQERLTRAEARVGEARTGYAGRRLTLLRARVHAAVGQRAEALATLDDAQARAIEAGDRLALAEVWVERAGLGDRRGAAVAQARRLFTELGLLPRAPLVTRLDRL